MDPQLKGYLDTQFTGINRRLDRIDGRLDAHDGRFDAIDGRLDGIDKRLDEHDARFDAIDRRLDAHGDSLKENQEEIRQTQVMVEHLQSDIQAIAEGHAVINGKLDLFIDEVQRQRAEDQAAYRSDVRALKQRDDALEERMAALEAARR